MAANAAASCKRRFRSKRLRQVDRLHEQVETRHNAVDQTKARRLGRVECPSSQFFPSVLTLSIAIIFRIDV
jgi:hypothetical protein